MPKQAMIDYMRSPKRDELYTPKYALDPLLEFIPTFETIWEPTDFGDSNITKVLRERGNKVITSHINAGQNFFTYEPKEDYDIIITNPPFSIKNEFLERVYELDKPFCFLLPITALGSIKRGKIFRENNIEVLVLDKRVNFMKNKDRCWFNTSWFCNRVLPEKLIFKSIEKE